MSFISVCRAGFIGLSVCLLVQVRLCLFSVSLFSPKNRFVRLLFYSVCVMCVFVCAFCYISVLFFLRKAHSSACFPEFCLCFCLANLSLYVFLRVFVSMSICQSVCEYFVTDKTLIMALHSIQAGRSVADNQRALLISLTFILSMNLI